MDLLDPSDDLVFKVLFKDPEAERRLIAMLTAILEPSSPIVSARVLNPHLPPEVATGKAVVLDIRVVLGDGRRICIELEARPRRVFIQRDLFYWSRTYSGQLDSGENYAALRPTIAIAWLGDPQDGSRSIVDSPNVHTRYRIRETTTNVELTDHLEIHLLDLRNLATDGTLSPALRRWAEFFDHPSEATLARLSEEDAVMADTIKKLEAVSSDFESKLYAEARLLAQVAHSMENDEARAAGRVEGFAVAVIAVAESRLGPLPGPLRARITRAEASVLERLMTRVGVANSCEELESLLDS